MVNIMIQACKQIHSEASQEDPMLEAGKNGQHTDTGLQAASDFHSSIRIKEGVFRIVSYHFFMAQMGIPETNGNSFIKEIKAKTRDTVPLNQESTVLPYSQIFLFFCKEVATHRL
jgi:hypothetical protein